MPEERDDRLTEALGAEPPAGVAAMPGEHREQLAAQVDAAYERQLQLVEEAVAKALKGVPLPVRGIVRKALTG